VVGVDLSDEAVRCARALSERAGIPARFEHADIYDWLTDTARRGCRFDAVYCS
jgi:23S rRNA G2069 N7-methylase RlmK/C1962 C5-methylase RlmI